jgi:hypothetical protein
MRLVSLFAVTAFAIACGGSSAKKDSSIVPTGDVPTQCCCKTIPPTAEKEIEPVYAMSGRMECSTNQGECVDDVQCNSGDQSGTSEQSSDGNPPPPPPIEPSTTSPIGE